MIITFCGHDSVPDCDEVCKWLNVVLDQYVYEDELVCYLGGYGGFDRLAASVVKKKKELHPNIQAILVIPYLNQKYDENSYDAMVFPPLESVPPRFVISRRNEWMVTQSDVVVAYVTHGWGGAAKTVEYARRKKKKIIVFDAKTSS